jgi:hypothetical protein
MFRIGNGGLSNRHSALPDRSFASRHSAWELRPHDRIVFLRRPVCKRFQELPRRPIPEQGGPVRVAGARRQQVPAIFLDMARFVGAVSAVTRMKAVSETDYTAPDTRGGNRRSPT